MRREISSLAAHPAAAGPRIGGNATEKGHAMTSANIAFVQSLYAAFGKGDIATIVAGMAPDVDWVVNGDRKDFPSFGSWKGQGEVQKFFHAVADNQDAKVFDPQ